MYCPTVAVVLSTTPTFVSAMVLGAILLQIHAPALFLCRILSTGCMAYQVSAYIPVPMSCVFWCLAWAYPCFPPKQRMQKYLTYKQKTYSLDIRGKATPEKFRKWEEVMHYLNHLPEFVNEVFEVHQMDTIVNDFFDYVKSNFDGEPTAFRIRKRYQETQVPLQKTSRKHVVWWQIAVERLFCCDDILSLIHI